MSSSPNFVIIFICVLVVFALLGSKHSKKAATANVAPTGQNADLAQVSSIIQAIDAPPPKKHTSKLFILAALAIYMFSRKKDSLCNAPTNSLTSSELTVFGNPPKSNLTDLQSKCTAGTTNVVQMALINNALQPVSQCRQVILGKDFTQDYKFTVSDTSVTNDANIEWIAVNDVQASKFKPLALRLTAASETNIYLSLTLGTSPNSFALDTFANAAAARLRFVVHPLDPASSQKQKGKAIVCAGNNMYNMQVPFDTTSSKPPAVCVNPLQGLTNCTLDCSFKPFEGVLAAIPFFIQEKTPLKVLQANDTEVTWTNYSDNNQETSLPFLQFVGNPDAFTLQIASKSTTYQLCYTNSQVPPSEIQCTPDNNKFFLAAYGDGNPAGNVYSVPIPRVSDDQFGYNDTCVASSSQKPYCVAVDGDETKGYICAEAPLSDVDCMNIGKKYKLAGKMIKNKCAFSALPGFLLESNTFNQNLGGFHIDQATVCRQGENSADNTETLDYFYPEQIQNCLPQDNTKFAKIGGTQGIGASLANTGVTPSEAPIQRGDSAGDNIRDQKEEFNKGVDSSFNYGYQRQFVVSTGWLPDTTFYSGKQKDIIDKAKKYCFSHTEREMSVKAGGHTKHQECCSIKASSGLGHSCGGGNADILPDPGQNCTVTKEANGSTTVRCPGDGYDDCGEISGSGMLLKTASKTSSTLRDALNL